MFAKQLLSQHDSVAGNQENILGEVNASLLEALLLFWSKLLLVQELPHKAPDDLAGNPWEVLHVELRLLFLSDDGQGLGILGNRGLADDLHKRVR